MELGTSKPSDLAFDVDDGPVEEDPEALESEEERDLNEEFGLHPDEETEGR